MLVLVLAGCSGEPQDEVTVSVGAARWMAVRTTEEPGWRKVDGEVTRIATDGDFEVAVVCREDIGDGWTWLATPGDIEPDDDGVRLLESNCRSPGGATVVFDVVGDVYGIYIGTGATYGPTSYSTEIEPGVHDVVAVRNVAEPGGAAERVQIIRGVRIEPGMNRIAIDVEAMGQPLAAATVEINGEAPRFAYHYGYTAGGTWFRIEDGAFFDGDLLVLPPALAVDGDREYSYVSLDGDRWLDVMIHDGLNALVTDTPVVDATFLIGGTTMQLSWPATAVYDRMTLGSWQIINDSPDRPAWSLRAYRGALANRTAGGTTTVTMSPPDLPEFQPAWFTNFDAAYMRTANWWHVRADGYEGFTDSARFTP